VREVKHDDEFFIGYAPPMPPRLARFIARAVLTLAGAVVAWAVVAATGHVSLEGGTFEFGHSTSVAGRIIERPYPALQVDTADRSLSSLMLLVAPGKHGADSLVRGMNGQRVTVSGTRIQRDAQTMLELDPASLAGARAAQADAADIRLPTDDLGEFELTGEIIDSKCFLGVMVPGSGKTHADCASLCIRGGMPPALHVQNFSGRSELLLLTGPTDEPIHAEAVAAAGQTVTMRGSVSRRGGRLFLKAAQGFSPAMRRSR
jgi:hypothetical protein